MKWSLIICHIYLGICFAQLRNSFVNEEKCEVLGGPGTYLNLKNEVEQSRICMQAMLVTDDLAARNTLEKIFQLIKHGNPTKYINVCLKNYIESTNRCLWKQEKIQFNAVVKMLLKLLHFADGQDRQGVMEFIKEGGIECMQSRIGELTNCYSDYSHSYYYVNGSYRSLNKIGGCKTFEKLEKCFKRELEGNCPGNISAVINGFIKSTKCTDGKEIEGGRSLRRMVRDIGGLGEHYHHIERTVKHECVNNFVNARELDDTLEKMKKCIDEKHIFEVPKHEFIEHLDKCTKEPIKVFKKCLPEKYKYIPDFLFALVDSIVKLLYDDFREIGFALGPCISKLKSHESHNKYEQCISKEKSDLDEIPSSKAEFCKKFLKISKCFPTQIEETCTLNDDLRKFNKDYMTAMEEPCKENTTHH